MCVQIPHAHKFWKPFSCCHDIPETDAILNSPNPYPKIWQGCISMFAHCIYRYAQSYYCGGVTDLDEWADIPIKYPQGSSCSLGELLHSPEKMEAFLLRLSGQVQSWRGTPMFFQYGKTQCTALGWATKNMQWKIILPVEIVKPLLWAAVDQQVRTATFSETRNKSTHIG